MIVAADIVVLAPDGHRVAVVEVQNSRNLSAKDGDHRLALMRLTGGVADYFLLISQDLGYLWRHDQTQGDPPMQFPMDNVVRRYFKQLGGEARLYGFQLEMIVSHWLAELASGWRGPEEEPERRLENAGFLRAIQHGQILNDAPL